MSNEGEWAAIVPTRMSKAGAETGVTTRRIAEQRRLQAHAPLLIECQKSVHAFFAWGNVTTKTKKGAHSDSNPLDAT